MLMDPNVLADSCCEAFVRKHQNMSRIVAIQNINNIRVKGHWQTDVRGIVAHFEQSIKATKRAKIMAARLWMDHLKKSDECTRSMLRQDLDLVILAMV